MVKGQFVQVHNEQTSLKGCSKHDFATVGVLKDIIDPINDSLLSELDKIILLILINSGADPAFK